MLFPASFDASHKRRKVSASHLFWYGSPVGDGNMYSVSGNAALLFPDIAGTYQPHQQTRESAAPCETCFSDI